MRKVQVDAIQIWFQRTDFTYFWRFPPLGTMLTLDFVIFNGINYCYHRSKTYHHASIAQ